MAAILLLMKLARRKKAGSVRFRGHAGKHKNPSLAGRVSHVRGPAGLCLPIRRDSIRYFLARPKAEQLELTQKMNSGHAIRRRTKAHQLARVPWLVGISAPKLSYSTFAPSNHKRTPSCSASAVRSRM